MWLRSNQPESVRHVSEGRDNSKLLFSTGQLCFCHFNQIQTFFFFFFLEKPNNKLVCIFATDSYGPLVRVRIGLGCKIEIIKCNQSENFSFAAHDDE